MHYIINMSGGNSCQYVTWEKESGGLGVHSGNYFSDNYIGAKENFAVRTGILRKSKLLSETEMMERTMLSVYMTVLAVMGHIIGQI
ncbi:hypothetical protein [Ruminiclostridium papyrosolvens]|uniref:Uncharacterized protein n=1 Tax=Ruminiclostridium papyrosolvens C7 TaxID=1330534 RepID=U4R218_9FIRM|nr:hypothetical protein [Ruminiclostridium papyrosolvens]EPR11499.1 hypothetical protein L323_11895 [Ruminiclostridium papyrosolvens C7]